MKHITNVQPQRTQKQNNALVEVGGRIAGRWSVPALIQPNNFIYKSLSSWSFNTAIGCAHGCRFCYVPSVATIKQSAPLEEYGIEDPDREWGRYVLLRPWDEGKFLASLRAAENTPVSRLNPDGNRAVMYCSTTDPYQVIRHDDSEVQKELAALGRHVIRRSLELIRDQSTLNVRILTRSPLARRDFDLFRSFGSRLMFGMSLPTLRNDLARAYEPNAPAPSQRLAVLREAKAAGLNVFVAIAPTYPECDEDDMKQTLKSAAEADPLTIFHEPINIRAENIARIVSSPEASELILKAEVFSSRPRWRSYARASLATMWRLADELHLQNRVHLWPDKSLGSARALSEVNDSVEYSQWLKARWARVSEWPRL